MTGIITTVGPRRVFVRLGSQPYSMAVYPAELEFIARRRSDAVRRPNCTACGLTAMDFAVGFSSPGLRPPS
ncbi:hypothetical protein KIP88_39965 [Bradyrhizobium sp. SRL28]|uniref:hypothetical protein n=1 Tax=Bradyrhizobium sp. SRL28 TaxID=2836178 RepID=UPI001BDEC01A|nr:hypothetical protein [Bradyrhizobium sp. SRL28]MBT1516602.1 hypothetical protein [Bradyrhizobium sp. SRL28]